MIGLVEPTGGVPLYQKLKITLKYSQPKIWRRIVVPANFELDRLHDVIQRVMPWTNSHMHHFMVGAPYGRDCTSTARPTPNLPTWAAKN